jgi:hypothetical protein
MQQVTSVPFEVLSGSTQANIVSMMAANGAYGELSVQVVAPGDTNGMADQITALSVGNYSSDPNTGSCTARPTYNVVITSGLGCGTVLQAANQITATYGVAYGP